MSGTALEAAAASRCGVSHTTNQDAFLVDVAGGFFAVADGMGGHRDGHIASNAVVSVLGRLLDPDARFEDKIDRATHALQRVNGTLHAQTRSEADISGSTIVTLIVDEGYACCLWAGDSRLYLYRDGDLHLLSQDHANGDGTLTRAIGSTSRLELERRIVEVRIGDVFLICSDGLQKGVEDNAIAALLGAPGEAPADRLLAKAVAGGSRDDITLVLVWVLDDET